MKPKVYIETSIVSYLTALPSRDIVAAARQQLTRDWWETRQNYELYISQAVLMEAGMGDPAAAQRRLNALGATTQLSTPDAAEDLASKLLEASAMPKQAALDALHVSLATVHGMDYLLTWNCRHIANAVMRPKIEAACRDAGFEPATICTPEELVEEPEL